MKYLLHYADEAREFTAEERREDEEQLRSWLDDTVGSGVNLQGSRLEPLRKAATVRAGDGELLVTDGPFAETKERVAGLTSSSAQTCGRRSRSRAGIPRSCTARSRPGRSC